MAWRIYWSLHTIQRLNPEAICLKYDVEFDKWRREHFLDNRSNMMTTNISEPLNLILRDKKKYPIAIIFNSISQRFSENFWDYYAKVRKGRNVFVPGAEKIISENIIEANVLHVTNVNRNVKEFTIIRFSYTAKVNLLDKSYSYRRYDLDKIPCPYRMGYLIKP